MSLSDRLRKFFVTNPPERTAPRPADDPGANATWNGQFVGPGFPITPLQGGGTKPPRYFDYLAGVNANVQPRTEYAMLPNFFQLWTAYENSSLLKTLVTFRTQELLSLDWKLKPKDGSGFRAQSSGIERARRLIEHPDPQMDYGFEQWLGSVLEEICVTDALTIVPRRNKLKQVVGFMQVDGQTIKPLLDYQYGGIPVPPDPAFVQYIKGSAFEWFTSEQMIYRPFRPRVWCVYGRPRVENVLMAAALYQVHENWTADYFTQGNIPEAAVLLDKDLARDLPPAKFKEWQEFLDMTAGINVGRRRLHMLPPWAKDIKPLKAFSFERELPDWMVRTLCIEFGVPSYLFTAETNRATAKEMNEVIHDAPLRVVLMTVKRLMDKLLEVAGFFEVEFSWQKQPDYSLEAVQGIVNLVAPPNNGPQIMTVLEARQVLGLAGEDELDEAGEEDTEGGADDAVGDVAGEDDADEPVPGDPPPDPDGQPDEKPVAKVVAINRSKTIPAKKFNGRGAAKRARLATGLAKVVLKRMRQNQSKVMEEAVARARARGRAVRATERS